MRFRYPDARRGDVVDDYHGTLVADPYRWLEDPGSDEAQAFVAAQNGITEPYLDSLPERAVLASRMRELWDVERTSAPTTRAGVTVWTHNDGLDDQPRIYVRSPGSEAASVLLDPNTMSADGAVAVVVTSLSLDGALLGYSVAEAGSDWQEIRIREVASGIDLDDSIRHVKFTPIAWHLDGFFYARFPAPEPGSTAPSRDMSVHYHRIGTDQSADSEMFSNPANPDLGYQPIVSDDGHFLVLEEWDGTSPHNGLLYRRLDGAAAEWSRLFEPGIARFHFVAATDDSFIVHTDLDAPNGRVVEISLDAPGDDVEVIAETSEPVAGVVAAAGRIVMVRLSEANHRLESYGLDGSYIDEIPLPVPGTVTAWSGRLQDPDLYLGFESFTHPPTALRWSNDRTEIFAGAAPPLDPSKVEVERMTAISADGTEVGMFVVRHVGSPLPAPTELYGYGGFNIDLTPTFSPARLAFLEAGGVVAVANLRGGSEHGEAWHRAGMLGNKQKVFDDFIACAESLIGAGVAEPGTVGVRGGSNGGLLTAAVMLQRPDLFGAVVSQVPVADMLRYQHFTAGRYWTVEYGDSAEPEAFGWLHAYSPYHNVESGTRLPPLLITTAESDDRVVPMHALKLAAAVQHAAGGASEQPLLLRVETRAGHGLGKPTSKLIEESADVYAFLLHHTSEGVR